MSVQWHYNNGSKQVGPISSTRLKELVAAGVIKRETPVRRTAQGVASGWVEAGTVKALFAKPFDEPPSLPPQYAEAVSKPAKVAGSSFIVSSTFLPEEHVTIGMVVGFASQEEGCGGGVKVEKTYQQALNRAIESAKAQGANGLAGVSFQNRVATSAGCGGSKQVFEVFVWGTAVTYYLQ